MNKSEAKKIVKLLSEMADHCCKGCAQSLTQYFIDAFPEHRELAITEFYYGAIRVNTDLLAKTGIFMIMKIFYKYLICKLRGHVFALIQEKTWKDYYKQVCKHCDYTDGVEYPSPVKIEPQMDGTLKIITKGSGGWGATNPRGTIVASGGVAVGSGCTINGEYYGNK